MGFPNGVKQRSFFSLIFSQNNKVDILGSGISKVQSPFIFPGLLLISLVLILKLSTVESSRRQGWREIIFQHFSYKLLIEFQILLLGLNRFFTVYEVISKLQKFSPQLPLYCHGFLLSSPIQPWLPQSASEKTLYSCIWKPQQQTVTAPSLSNKFIFNLLFKEDAESWNTWRKGHMLCWASYQ